MENLLDNVDETLEWMMQNMRVCECGRSLARSLPRRNHRRVNSDDHWNGGSRGGHESQHSLSPHNESQPSRSRNRESSNSPYERSCQGLCFKCEERWGSNHICKMKHYWLQLMEGLDDEPVEVEEVEGDEEETPELELKTLQLFLRSLRRFTSRKSSKLKGTLKGIEITVLVNCGATINFLSKLSVF